MAHSYDDLETGLVTEMFRSTDLEYNSEWAFHRYMLDEARAGRPLGSPLSESRYITVGGQRYAIQTFALDTLYTPLADVESDTNWSDVRRLSDLLNTSQQTPISQQSPAMEQQPAPAPEQQQPAPAPEQQQPAPAPEQPQPTPTLSAVPEGPEVPGVHTLR
jgi:hypothetical protein